MTTGMLKETEFPDEAGSAWCDWKVERGREFFRSFRHKNVCANPFPYPISALRTGRVSAYGVDLIVSCFEIADGDRRQWLS